METPFLSCTDVHKIFHKKGAEYNVLRDINFTIQRGEIIRIFGRSGVGKSVLLSLLCGIDRPTSGEINFQGMPLHQLSASQLAHLRSKEIGIIFQNFNLISYWTALENVEAAFSSRAVSRQSVRDSAIQILTQLGLRDRLSNMPAELSMGEQQRIALARTLIKKPKLILADEPIGEVDSETAEMMVSLLHEHVENYGATLIITTHGHFPERDADRCFEILDGQLLNKEKIHNVSSIKENTSSECHLVKNHVDGFDFEV